MLIRFLVLVILNFSAIATQDVKQKQPATANSTTSALTPKSSQAEEEAAEDKIFQKVLQQQACALHTRSGARFRSFKEDKNHNPHAGNNICTNQ